MHSILTFDKVSYTWPGGKGLSAVSLNLPKGTFMLITGPSGSGKSTLLRLAARLELPQHGIIRFDGHPLSDYAPPELRARIGFIQQQPVVVEGSVRHNLLLPFSFAVNRQRNQPDDDALAAWLTRFALHDVSLSDEAADLSVGQRQRICLIRSMLLTPEVLLMDEPTSALDAESRRIVEEITEELVRLGTAVMMVNHGGYRPRVPYIHARVADGRVVLEHTKPHPDNLTAMTQTDMHGDARESSRPNGTAATSTDPADTPHEADTNCAQSNTKEHAE